MSRHFDYEKYIVLTYFVDLYLSLIEYISMNPILSPNVRIDYQAYTVTTFTKQQGVVLVRNEFLQKGIHLIDSNNIKVRCMEIIQVNKHRISINIFLCFHHDFYRMKQLKYHVLLQNCLLTISAVAVSFCVCEPSHTSARPDRAGSDGYFRP